MNTLISVIMCTHNPRADYLSRALDSLKKQTLPVDMWEFLFIDNASTKRLADEWDIAWHPQGHHVREENLGLSFARLRGIKESRGSLLVFVDDDNVLAPDFLEQALTMQARYPFLGTFGAGVLNPEFEVPPPPELVSLVGMLALRTVPAVRWSNNVDDSGSIPWGAGLCVKREVANEYQRLMDRLNATAVIDRRGKQLFAGGDDVFSWAAVAAGWGFGVIPELRITHLISEGRLTQEYFLRLIRDHAFSHGVLGYLRTGVRPHQFGMMQNVRLLLHGLKNGQFSMRCQLAEVKGQSGATRFIAERNLSSINLCTPSHEVSVEMSSRS